MVKYCTEYMAMRYSSECILHSSTNHFERMNCVYIINYAVLY